MGGAWVVAADGRLAGFLTDGDLRRALTNHDDIRTLRAADAMTATPVTVGPEANLGQALELMERRRSQIPVLPVVDGEGRALGLLPGDSVGQTIALQVRNTRWGRRFRLPTADSNQELAGESACPTSPCIPLELHKSYKALSGLLIG
jgi:CBS domain-containing protein